MYSGYEIPLKGECLWSFGNGFSRNVIIFGVDNSSSPHSNNFKIKFLVLVNDQHFVLMIAL